MAQRTFQAAEGMAAIDLPSYCQVQYYALPAQSVNTLVLTCPRMEPVRLWPLLVVDPWNEDWWESQEEKG